MKSFQVVSFALIMVFFCWGMPRAVAEDVPQSAGVEPAHVPVPVLTPQVPGPRKPDRSKPSQKPKRPREKEAEGTEAADRFEADTVIKSKYQLNGEPLEVDPD